MIMQIRLQAYCRHEVNTVFRLFELNYKTSENRLEKIGRSHLICNILSVDGQFEGFHRVESTIRRKIKRILLQETEPKSPVISDSLISGALSMALSYVNRMQHSGDSSSSPNNALGDSSGRSRVLVMSASGDTATQYMSYMNVFFSAQKMNVNIDTCMLEKDSGLLQQVSGYLRTILHGTIFFS